MMQVYGYDAQSPDDPYIALAQKLSRITTEAHEPGRWLVDSFPWLRYVPSWMPFAHFKTWAAKARSDSIRFTRAPFDLAQSTLVRLSIHLVDKNDRCSIERRIFGVICSNMPQ